MRVLLAVLVVGLLVIFYRLLVASGTLELLLDSTLLQERVSALGPWGPLGIVGLMSVAIVLNPIPSAPIALAAGAVYGHTWGTVYVAVGAEVGALAAFGIARWLGRDVMHRIFGERLSMGLLGSQNALMGMVFASRLLPFISFDLMSYAAGLTPLNAWRFAVATLAGIIPASFLLAHFGREMATLDPGRITWAVLALGTVTLIPLLVKAVLVRRSKKRKK
jgi:uncharacterized membrane protein YdjX (TVP38/TMEM64 family)